MSEHESLHAHEIIEESDAALAHVKCLTKSWTLLDVQKHGDCWSRVSSPQGQRI